MKLAVLCNIVRGFFLGILVLSVAAMAGSFMVSESKHASALWVCGFLGVFASLAAFVYFGLVKDKWETGEKEWVIHQVEHVLHAFGWPSLLVGLVSFVGGLDWLWGKYSMQLFFFGGVGAILGLFFLHISWNLRRNFRRIFLD